jgi:dihydrofolate synthase/folylpolyglutamate synthase
MEQFLSRLHHPTLAQIDLKLDRMLRLLSMLGNPHKRLPPVIHVAGTNGKGSTIATLRAIFEAAGLRVHVYTSPHLVEFRERIVLAGKMIENAQITQIANHVSRILEQQPATFFEATTALAFLAFAQSKADILLLETGMGGRLDATNAIEKPLLTVITPIAFDHMEFLGDTIAKIAAEKAGIMKRGVPCIVGKQTDEVMVVLREKALEIGATLIPFTARALPALPSLPGVHQLDNAATAIACIEQLPQFGVTTEHIAQGLANTVWPARLQKLSEGAYRKMLPPHCELWLDGGHNPQGGEVLAAWLAEKKLPTYVVCGMVGKKDASGYMQAITPHVKALWAVAIPEDKESKHPVEVADAARKAGISAQEAANIETALADIAALAPPSALVIIAGSLYLAGFVLKTHR